VRGAFGALLTAAVASAAFALALACALSALGAPLPPPRPRPAPPPVTAGELAGLWELGDGRGRVAWYVTLAPGGLYYCDPDRVAHDNREWRYRGTWELVGQSLRVRELHVDAMPGSEPHEYEAPLRRPRGAGAGGPLDAGPGAFLSGRWTRR
jgi:hypothetical protein